jgi:protein-cysteine N-palmitoyltransferase HHAT
MNPLALFKVETLDTRFASATSQPLPHARPSKWNTPEYYIYYLFFLTIPFLMFKSVYDVSKPDHPSYQRYEHLLSQGWIPGRKVDNSDTQYRGFRDNVPYLSLLLLLHPLARRTYERFRSSATDGTANGSVKKDDVVVAQEGNARLSGRINFDVAFAVIFLIALHGVSAAKVLLILYVNYLIPTRLPKGYVSIATWTFNIGILFANELCRGYPFADIFSLILPSHTTNADQKSPPDVNWGAWLDSYGGLTPRWEVLFNLTVLRLIAFNFDYLWMLDRRDSSPIEVRLSINIVITY